MGELHRLVRKNDVEGVRAALRDPATACTLANEVDEFAKSPLFDAVSSGNTHLAIIQALLEAGAEVNFIQRHRLAPFSIQAFWDRDNPPPLEPESGTAFDERLLSKAIQNSGVEVLELLRRYGADFGYQRQFGSTALHDAISDYRNSLSVLTYLLSLGLDPNKKGHGSFPPIFVAYPRLEMVKALLNAGASEEPLGWTPLIRAIAIGSPDEIEEALSQSSDLSRRDNLGLSALDIAIVKGDLHLSKRIVDLFDQDGRAMWQDSAIAWAVQQGHLPIVEWLIAEGAGPNVRNEDGDPVLKLAAKRGNLAMVEFLLKAGADPSAEIRFGSMLEGLTDRETIRTLLRHGADPRGLGDEERRCLLGLGDADLAPLERITREEYLAGRHPSEAAVNGAETTDPFRVAMIRAGIDAYSAREYFGDPWDYEEGGGKVKPVWCAHRFGQSVTELPDGRMILIGGEHEDGYDPDFCIYNDVFVFHLDGRIQIFGYPYEVFPPTDSHTSTLVGDHIYIIGSIGYQGQRQTGIPVWRLQTSDYRIEPLPTTGREPGRIFKHRAELINPDTIEISEGKRLCFEGSEETIENNEDTFRLDLRTLTWT